MYRPGVILGNQRATRILEAIKPQTGIELPRDYKERLQYALSSSFIGEDGKFEISLSRLDEKVADGGKEYHFYPTKLLINKDATSHRSPTNGEIHADAYLRLSRGGLIGLLRGKSTGPFVNLVLSDRRLLELMEQVSVDNPLSLLGRISFVEADRSISRRPFLIIPGLTKEEDIAKVIIWGTGKKG